MLAGSGRRKPCACSMRSLSPADIPAKPVRAEDVAVRRVREEDAGARGVPEGALPAVISLDARITGLPKPEYWEDIYRRYGRRRLEERFFLVAAEEGRRAPVFGFIVAEVRAWEFGSAPCGWGVSLSLQAGGAAARG